MKNYGEYDGPRTSEGWRLKKEQSREYFIKYLFSNDVPHESVSRDVWRLNPEVRFALEKAGWEFEKYEIMNIGKLLLEERNRIKGEARDPKRRERAIKELLEKYGNL
ncbi:MAG: hypothetical protein ABIA78_00515 [archaeon]